VKTGDVTTPEAFVVAVFTPPAKVPLGWVEGGVNTTVTPLTGLPLTSFTVATRGAAKGKFTVALWGVPLVTVIEAGAAAIFVSEKLAEVAMPVADAVTT
jgi:hypothetical protein